MYLKHYGVKGMKWGVRKGPPYPVVSRRKNTMTIAKNLYKTLDKFDYGCIIDGRRYNETNLDSVDWSRYRTTPVKTFAKNKIGVCWDFTNYQHEILKKAGIKHGTYMLVMDSDNGPITHTFTTFNDPETGKQYWFEQSLYSKRGIHEINNYKNVVDSITQIYDSTASRPYDVYTFNPDGMDRGLSDQEFFNMATASDPILQHK